MISAVAAQNRTLPSPGKLIERANEIGTVAHKRAVEIEKARRCPADIVQMMHDAELFRVMQPAKFGGFEYGWEVFIETVAAIASGDGSTGWVYSLGAVHQWLIGCFPTEAQQEVWGKDSHAIAAGSYAPVGNAVREGDGHRIIEGRWSFASGCDNAQWAFLGSILTTSEGPKPGFFLVPRSELSIEDDWNTVGLAGTGSKSLLVRDVYVPPNRAVTFADLLVGNGPGGKVNGLLFRQPLLAVLPACLVSPALGMARGALKAFADHVGGRTTRGAVAGGANRMRDFATIQLRVAEATACIDAAQLMLHRDLRETFDKVSRGEPISLDFRMRNRLTHTFSAKLLTQAVDVCFAALGGSALGLHHPVQRFWRDIHAVASHISLNWDAVGAMYGQHAFGLEPKGQY
jgi:resorcinol 4-hydroxylase (FADH2)